MSLLVICELLGVFAHTFTADYKCSLRDSENLPQPSQIQLSKNKTFSQCFAAALKYRSNFAHFEEKDDRQN